jgi:CRP-like cAMP-binding protein
MAETALERQLSTTIMKGNAKPEIASLPAGSLLFHQGEPGRSLYLVLDGVLEVEVDNERVAQVGPGAVVGERAILEQGMRTATLRAVTDCRLAEADVDAIDRAALIKLAMGHRREGT